MTESASNDHKALAALEAERDGLRARLAAVEALADSWSDPDSLRNGAWLRERDAADDIRAALADRERA